MMDTAAFWNLIEQTRARHRAGEGEQADLLLEDLLQRKPKEVADFQHTFDHFFWKAYRWDVWAAAYILLGGCSDDAFMDFRGWLIAQGRETFERVVADPASLSLIVPTMPASEDGMDEMMLYAASQAYEQLTDGNPMPPSALAENPPEEPAGAPFDEETVDQLYPDLVTAVEARWALVGNCDDCACLGDDEDFSDELADEAEETREEV